MRRPPRPHPRSTISRSGQTPLRVILLRWNSRSPKAGGRSGAGRGATLTKIKGPGRFGNVGGRMRASSRRVGKGGPNLRVRHGFRSAVPTRRVPPFRVGTAEPTSRHIAGVSAAFAHPTASLARGDSVGLAAAILRSQGGERAGIRAVLAPGGVRLAAVEIVLAHTLIVTQRAHPLQVAHGRRLLRFDR